MRTPPSWITAGTHTAENDRNGTKATWGIEGVRLGAGYYPQTAGGASTGDFAVTQSTVPAMSVQIASGYAFIQGSTTATQGMYQVFNDAAATLTIASNNSGNPRIDLICVTIRDSQYSGTNDDVILQVITGTPAASPTVPATPASSLALAKVSVANAASTIINANITDLRVKADIADGSFTSSTAAADSLAIQTITSQTGNALNVLNTSGTSVARISAAGKIAAQTANVSYANATARDAAITAPVAGDIVFMLDSVSFYYYSGSAWTPATSVVTGDSDQIVVGVQVFS